MLFAIKIKTIFEHLEMSVAWLFSSEPEPDYTVIFLNLVSNFNVFKMFQNSQSKHAVSVTSRRSCILVDFHSRDVFSCHKYHVVSQETFVIMLKYLKFFIEFVCSLEAQRDQQWTTSAKTSLTWTWNASSRLSPLKLNAGVLRFTGISSIRFVQIDLWHRLPSRLHYLPASAGTGGGRQRVGQWEQGHF